MAKIKVTLTEDMIKVISCLRFQEFPGIREDDTRQELIYELDMNSLYGGNFVLEDMSYILGLYDQHIPGTECDATGPRFPKELEDKMLEIHCYIVDNLPYIEQILHQFCWQGGITPGTYVANQFELFWTKKED